MKQKFQQLHEVAIEIAAKFHQAESDLIDVLQKIDTQKLFVRLGYGSLFDYATKALKLSEANASNFIAVARKSVTIPELKNAIRKGEISVSKARKITPVLTKDNAIEWLKLAKELPKPKLEREVARASPQAATIERARYVAENRLELKLGVSDELMAKLRRAQDLTSQKSKKAASLEETFEEILNFYLLKQDPVQKAERSLEKDSSNNPSINDTSASVPGTRKLKARQRHQVFNRDKGQCTYKDKSGLRCESRRWIEIHHEVPLSKGGTNNSNNLRTLCSAHHKFFHQTS